MKGINTGHIFTEAAALEGKARGLSKVLYLYTKLREIKKQNFKVRKSEAL